MITVVLRFILTVINDLLAFLAGLSAISSSAAIPFFIGNTQRSLAYCRESWGLWVWLCFQDLRDRVAAAAIFLCAALIIVDQLRDGATQHANGDQHLD
jgi:hypothetical protein